MKFVDILLNVIIATEENDNDNNRYLYIALTYPIIETAHWATEVAIAETSTLDLN